MNQKAFQNSNMALASELNRTARPTSNPDLTPFFIPGPSLPVSMRCCYPGFLPCHNSDQISIFDVSYPHIRKHFLTGPHWPCHGNPCPVQLRPSQRRTHDRDQCGGCREKGLSISIRYALKLQMSPTSTLRATQIRCSTSMRTASLARSFR